MTCCSLENPFPWDVKGISVNDRNLDFFGESGATIQCGLCMYLFFVTKVLASSKVEADGLSV